MFTLLPLEIAFEIIELLNDKRNFQLTCKLFYEWISLFTKRTRIKSDHLGYVNRFCNLTTLSIDVSDSVNLKLESLEHYSKLESLDMSFQETIDCFEIIQSLSKFDSLSELDISASSSHLQDPPFKQGLSNIELKSLKKLTVEDCYIQLDYIPISVEELDIDCNIGGTLDSLTRLTNLNGLLLRDSKDLNDFTPTAFGTILLSLSKLTELVTEMFVNSIPSSTEPSFLVLPSQMLRLNLDINFPLKWDSFPLNLIYLKLDYSFPTFSNANHVSKLTNLTSLQLEKTGTIYGNENATFNLNLISSLTNLKLVSIDINMETSCKWSSFSLLTKLVLFRLFQSGQFYNTIESDIDLSLHLTNLRGLELFHFQNNAHIYWDFSCFHNMRSLITFKTNINDVSSMLLSQKHLINIGILSNDPIILHPTSLERIDTVLVYARIITDDLLIGFTNLQFMTLADVGEFLPRITNNISHCVPNLICVRFEKVDLLPTMEEKELGTLPLLPRLKHLYIGSNKVTQTHISLLESSKSLEQLFLLSNKKQELKTTCFKIKDHTKICEHF